MKKVYTKSEWIRFGKSYKTARDEFNKFLSVAYTRMNKAESAKLTRLQKKFEDARCGLDTFCGVDLEEEFSQHIFYGDNT